jgi:3-oxoacyl-[acyl-carrier-protein] synthase III
MTDKAITGTGSYLPVQVVTNHDIERALASAGTTAAGQRLVLPSVGAGMAWGAAYAVSHDCRRA